MFSMTKGVKGFGNICPFHFLLYSTPSSLKSKRSVALALNSTGCKRTRWCHPSKSTGYQMSISVKVIGELLIHTNPFAGVEEDYEEKEEGGRGLG